jgi:hypothetical protein
VLYEIELVAGAMVNGCNDRQCLMHSLVSRDKRGFDHVDKISFNAPLAESSCLHCLYIRATRR